MEEKNRNCSAGTDVIIFLQSENGSKLIHRTINNFSLKTTILYNHYFRKK